MSQGAGTLSDAEKDIDDMSDSELIEALEQYEAALQKSEFENSTILKAQHPKLKGLFDCLDKLNQLAVPGQPEVRDEFGSTYVPQHASVPDESSVVAPLGQFGDYELLEEIGRGGMGVVYRARQDTLDREVALKMILASRFAGRDELRRFQQEARAAAKLKHDNIVRVFEVGDHGGQHFFTMEYVEGGSLSEMIATGPQEPEKAARMTVAIAKAVQYLHENNIVHRDLKPSNILIDQSGKVHVTDFGLAKITDNRQTQTESGAIIGTPSYMSPEQAAGRTREISPVSDIYALGALLFSMLTGRPPFREENPMDTLVQVIESEPPTPSSVQSGIPKALEKICLHCLEKDPKERYQSAAGLAEDLERFLRGEEPDIDAKSFSSRFAKWSRREPGLSSRLAAIVAAVSVVEVRYVFLGGDPWFHFTILIIFSLWAASSTLCQWLLNTQSKMSESVPFLWATVDVVLLTWVLSISEKPIGVLLIGYPTLVVAAGMWFRTNLVWFMTCGALISYAILLLIRPEITEPVHYPILYAAVLSVIGYMVAYQIQRVRALSRFYEHRKL